MDLTTILFHIRTETLTCLSWDLFSCEITATLFHIRQSNCRLGLEEAGTQFVLIETVHEIQLPNSKFHSLGENTSRNRVSNFRTGGSTV